MKLTINNLVWYSLQEPVISGTTVTMDGDSREFTSGSFTVTFPVGSDADTMVSLTAASLEANTTGLNITPVGPRLH